MMFECKDPGGTPTKQMTIPKTQQVDGKTKASFYVVSEKNLLL